MPQRLSTAPGTIPPVPDIDSLSSDEWDALAIKEWMEQWIANRDFDAEPPPSFQWENVNIEYAHDNPLAWQHLSDGDLPFGVSKMGAQQIMRERVGVEFEIRHGSHNQKSHGRKGSDEVDWSDTDTLHANAQEQQLIAQRAADAWYNKRPKAMAQDTWYYYQREAGGPFSTSGAGGFRMQNAVLRGPATPEKKTLEKRWDKAFSDGGIVTEKPMLLHRGLKSQPELSVGQIVRDNGVISSSADPLGAYQFSGGPDGMTMEIRVPAGTQIMGGHLGTFETMLKPGTDFRVIESPSTDYVLVEVVE